jgi:hypothetical protein
MEHSFERFPVANLRTLEAARDCCQTRAGWEITATLQQPAKVLLGAAFRVELQT